LSAYERGSAFKNENGHPEENANFYVWSSDYIAKTGSASATMRLEIIERISWHASNSNLGKVAADICYSTAAAGLEPSILGL
jgi:hypothetical protein